MKNTEKSCLIPAAGGFKDWKGNHLPVIVFLALSTALAYSSSLHGTWLLDDTTIGQYGSVENVLSFHIGYRKVAAISFLLNKWIDPVDPVNYRVFNIALHIFNSVLIYVLALVTLRLPGWKDKYGVYSFPVGFVSSAVFALHPININAVSYIVQRMTSLATMFVLLGLLSYIAARNSESRHRSFGLYLFSGFCVLAGIFSKENAVVSVPLILLYKVVFLSGPRSGRVSRRLAGISAGILILVTTSVFLKFQSRIIPVVDIFLNWNGPIPVQDWTATDVYWTPFQHVLTEFRVIGRYLFLIILPLPRFLVFDWWGFPVSAGLAKPLTTALSMALVFGAASFSLVRMKRLPFLSFGILWYLLAISLESFIVVGLDLYFEHRNYLPMAGLILGIAAQLVCYVKVERLKGKYVWGAVVALSLVLGSLTFQRNMVWEDSTILWQDTLDKAPGNLRAVISLGNAYLRAADFDSAEEYFKKGASVSEAGRHTVFFRDSVYSLGMVYLFMGDLSNARRVIHEMDSKLGYSHMNDILKGFYSSLDGDPDAAIERYQKILSETSWRDRVIVYTLLGDAYRKKSMPEKALANYREAVKIDPSFPAAYYGMGDTYLSKKEPDNALIYIGKTLELDPLNPLALAEMADILLITKRSPDEAMSFADRALANSPPFYQPYLTKANILVVTGYDAAAEEFYREAVERGLEDYMVPFSKARAYYLKGDPGNARIFLGAAAAMEDAPEAIREMAAP
jgi:tetratricopeptide (TPR) repeat protein